MNTDIITVKPDISINEFLDNYFDLYVKTEFPVVEEDGYLIGTVMAKDAMNVQESKEMR